MDAIHFDYDTACADASTHCRAAITTSAPAQARAMQAPPGEGFRTFLRELPEIILALGVRATEDYGAQDDAGEFDALAVYLTLTAWSLVYGDPRNGRQVEVPLRDLLAGMPKVGAALGTELIRRTGAFKSMAVPENPFTADAAVEYEVA